MVLIDFERRSAGAPHDDKQSPLRDVAGLLCSLVYALHAAQFRCATDAAEDCSRWNALLLEWVKVAREQFLAGYDRIRARQDL